MSCFWPARANSAGDHGFQGCTARGAGRSATERSPRQTLSCERAGNQSQQDGETAGLRVYRCSGKGQPQSLGSWKVSAPRTPTGDGLPGFRQAAWFLRRMQEMKTLCECSRLYPPGSVCRKGIDPGLSVNGVYVPA